MRKYFLFVFLIFISLRVISQIPNASFENWNSIGTYMNPSGWATMNNTTASSTIFTANRGTNSDSTRFLKLTSRTVGSSVVRGVAVSGILDTITLKPKSGFPFTSQPDSLVGQWIHMGHGGDPGMVAVTLTRWNIIMGKRDTVAFGYDTLGVMAMYFVPFGVKLNYLNMNPPDSCIIYLASSGNSASNFDYLYIDNLAFKGIATGIFDHLSILKEFCMYPNPSTNTVTLSLNFKYEGKISIQLTALDGKLLREKINEVIVPGENILNFDISGFSRGNYFISIIYPEGVETKKMIIE